MDFRDRVGAAERLLLLATSLQDHELFTYVLRLLPPELLRGVVDSLTPLDHDSARSRRKLGDETLRTAVNGVFLTYRNNAYAMAESLAEMLRFNPPDNLEVTIGPDGKEVLEHPELVLHFESLALGGGKRAPVLRFGVLKASHRLWVPTTHLTVRATKKGAVEFTACNKQGFPSAVFTLDDNSTEVVQVLQSRFFSAEGLAMVANARSQAVAAAEALVAQE